jgi:hypothetical protein
MNFQQITYTPLGFVSYHSLNHILGNSQPKIVSSHLFGSSTHGRQQRSSNIAHLTNDSLQSILNLNPDRGLSHSFQYIIVVYSLSSGVKTCRPEASIRALGEFFLALFFYAPLRSEWLVPAKLSLSKTPSPYSSTCKSLNSSSFNRLFLEMASFFFDALVRVFDV